MKKIREKKKEMRYCQSANSIRKVTKRANNAVASVKAKPKIAKRKSSSFNDGFLAMPANKALKMEPIPIPAPTKPTVVKPAPINFAA